MHDLSLAAASARDHDDPMRDFRRQFDIPQGIIYLDGNSLGALPNHVADRLKSAVTDDWGKGLIRSWNDADWVNLPSRIGAKIAPLIGAAPEHVVMADSTSVNLFKVISAALSLRPGRKKIITERRNFPTDNYIAEGVIKQLGTGHELIYIEDSADIPAMLDEDVAVMMLTHIHYCTGRMHDMAVLTKAAHDVGALAIWDLAHSAGAVPVQLDQCDVDFAVGCSYKYLNGGPGAPAFVYAAARHLGGFTQPLSGWFAHQHPFEFTPTYTPDTTIKQYMCGTPPVLSSVALDAALDIWRNVDMAQLRAKSLALTDYFMTLVDARCGDHKLTLITPRDHAHRGSQISYTHPTGGYAIIAALIAEGVIGDFRAPDIMRFGFTPLYTTFADVWHAVDKLADILETQRWDMPEFHLRKQVT